MKICCFIYSLDAGGAQRVMTNLANYWVSNGHELTIVTYDSRHDPYFDLDARIKLVQKNLSGGTFLRRLLNNILRIPKFRIVIKSVRPDIVLSFIDRTNVLVLLSTIGLKVPTIVSERVDPRCYDPGVLYSLLRKILYPRASAVVALSKAQAAWLSSLSKDVYVIPNPVLATKFGHINKSDGENKIVAAGRLVKQKGFDVLIEAFSRSVDRSSNWVLEIYGEGPERGPLQRKIATLNLTNRIFLRGSAKDLGAHLKSAQFFVLSSRFEGFPCVLLEALANSCPPIAVNCTDSIGEIIDHGRNGIIVSHCDVEALEKALTDMMSNFKYRSQLAANGSAIIEKYNIKAVSGCWENLFNLVMG